ncbi:hypothetical protein Goari_014503, partial [Gossypium aridum]|nr:hypothetical protein [Gossypium aridum]
KKLPGKGSKIERWRILEWLNLKINFDVTFNKQEKRSCSGIVIRDSNGEILGSKTVLNNNIPSVFAAKALTCVQTVQMSLKMGLSMVEVKGDALLVIRKSQSNGLDKPKKGACIRDIQQLKRGFQICWFKHTPRMANRVAHTLATKEKWLKLNRDVKEDGEIGKGRKLKTLSETVID